MRISDWSSDVCSSDLLADARNLTQSGHDVGDTILVVNGVDRKDKVKGTVGEGQGAVVPGGDLHCHPQIRRALGRHRHHVVVDLHAVEIEAAVGEGHEVVQVEATQVKDLQIGSASCRERVCQYV